MWNLLAIWWCARTLLHFLFSSIPPIDAWSDEMLGAYWMPMATKVLLLIYEIAPQPLRFSLLLFNIVLPFGRSCLTPTIVRIPTTRRRHWCTITMTRIRAAHKRAPIHPKQSLTRSLTPLSIWYATMNGGHCVWLCVAGVCVCVCACVSASTNAFGIIENVCRISIVTRMRRRREKKNLIQAFSVAVQSNARKPCWEYFSVDWNFVFTKTRAGDLLYDHIFSLSVVALDNCVEATNRANAKHLERARARAASETRFCHRVRQMMRHWMRTYICGVKCGQNKWILHANYTYSPMPIISKWKKTEMGRGLAKATIK